MSLKDNLSNLRCFFICSFELGVFKNPVQFFLKTSDGKSLTQRKLCRVARAQEIIHQTHCDVKPDQA